VRKRGGFYDQDFFYDFTAHWRVLDSRGRERGGRAVEEKEEMGEEAHLLMKNDRMTLSRVHRQLLGCSGCVIFLGR